MKLSVVFSIHNQFPLARVAIVNAARNITDKKKSHFFIIDNASENPLLNMTPTPDLLLSENIGVYPLFWLALKHMSIDPDIRDSDVIAFLHSDLIITEPGWDRRVLAEFEKRPHLGLMGFIGSNQIDKAGGRGLGTTSNFQGNWYTEDDESGGEIKWKGSKAKIHGAVSSGYSRAAVVDGCAMVFRRSVLEQIKQRENFPPHHFYDRLLSSEVRELGYEIGVLGVACDHISGQTVNQEPGYAAMAEKWAMEHGLKLGNAHNWDTVLYKEAERQWLSEYRDQKHLVPAFL